MTERTPSTTLCRDKDCVLPKTHVGKDAARWGRWHRNVLGQDYPHAIAASDPERAL